MTNNTWINIGGTWKEVISVWENVGGVWNSNVIPKGNINGAWKTFKNYLAPQPTIVTNGLIGYWNSKKNVNGSTWGNIAPSTLGIYNATLVNTSALTDGMTFDSINDYIDFNVPPTTGVATPYTWELRVKCDNLDDVPSIIADGLLEYMAFFDINGSVFKVEIGGVTETFTIPNEYQTLERYVTFSYNPIDGLAKFYINGVLIGQRVLSVNQFFSRDGLFRLGGSYEATPQDWHFLGILDNFRIYDRVLSDNEVLNNYNIGTAIGLPPENHYLSMDGIDDYVRTPSMTVTEIVMEFSANHSGSVQRYIDVGGAWITRGAGGIVDGFATNWDSVYVNGTQVTTSTTFVPSNAKVTLRGVLKTATTGVVTLFAGASTNLFLGGRLYDVKVYNAGVLVAHYDMKNDGTVQDISGNGRHATLYGGAWIINREITRDSFNRPDNATTLGTTEAGLVWQSYSLNGTPNVWGIQNNQAYPVTPIWDDPVFVEAGISDKVALQLKITTISNWQQIMWRIADGNRNYFMIQGNLIIRVVNDTYTNIGTISPSLANGDIVRIELRGSSHSIKVNGEERLRFIDSTFIDATKFGFSETGSSGSPFRLDDFLIEKLPSIETLIPNVPIENIAEEFRDDSYNFTFTQDSLYNWNRFDGMSPSGNKGYIKSSNELIPSSVSSITFDILVPSGTLKSWVEVDYAVDSEADFDFIFMYLNGYGEFVLSGDNKIGTTTIDLPAGSHKLKFEYKKDGNADDGADSAYVSGIRLLHEVMISKDTFSRANNATSLGTAIGGYVWQTYDANNVWGIQNNQAYPITPMVDVPVYIETGVSDNVAFELKIATVHPTQQIMWRIEDIDKYFVIQGDDVYRVMEGWALQGTISPSIQNGDTVRVELRGDSHVIKVNGSERFSFTHNANINGTKYGFSGNSTEIRYESILIADMGENLVNLVEIPNVSTTNIIEDFLDDIYNFTFEQEGIVNPWNRYDDASLDGNLGYIKTSNQDLDGTSSIINFDILVPSGTKRSWVEVDYAVDSEVDFDYLHINLNGLEKLKVSGLQQIGTTIIDNLDAGYHILTLKYNKDSNAKAGTDSAYVSGIRLMHEISNEVRYIRDWIGGSTVDNFRFWGEIQALDMSGINVALGKPVTHSEPVSGIFYTPEATNDGIIVAGDGNSSGTEGYSGEWNRPMFVQIDLESVVKLSAIKVWHYYGDDRTFQNASLEVSSDGVTWTKLFDSEVDGRYVETAEGKTHILTTEPLNEILPNEGYVQDGNTTILMNTTEYYQVRTITNGTGMLFATNLIPNTNYTVNVPIEIEISTTTSIRIAIWNVTQQTYINDGVDYSSTTTGIQQILTGTFNSGTILETDVLELEICHNWNGSNSEDMTFKIYKTGLTLNLE